MDILIYHLKTHNCMYMLSELYILFYWKMKHILKFISLLFNILFSKVSTFYFSHFVMPIGKYIFKSY